MPATPRASARTRSWPSRRSRSRSTKTSSGGYFSHILRSVQIPLIVQDASGYVGRPMPISLYARLLDEFGDRVYFKPEATPIGPRLSALRDATAGEARVFEGTGGMALVDSFRRGIVGTIPGADLVRGIVALWRALKPATMRARITFRCRSAP